MTAKLINIEKTLERILTVRPDATMDDVRRLVPAAATLHENDLKARVERIRGRLDRRKVSGAPSS